MDHSDESRLTKVVTIVASTLLLISPAFFNGYPFVDGDTGAYIWDAMVQHTAVNWARPVFYSIFIRLLHMKISLWPVVLVQGLIVSHILYLTIRVINQEVRPLAFLIIIFILTVSTSLPWLVGQISTDVFTGVVILGIFLLGWGLERLTRREKIYVFVLTSGAISLHLSHVPLALGLVIITIFLQRFVSGRGRFRVKELTLLFAPIMLAAIALLSVNIAWFGEVTLSPGSPIVLLARLIEDGPAKWYLEENCSEKKYALCSFRDELSSAQDFMWAEDSPLWKLGGPWKLRSEAKEIAWNSLRAYPIKQLQNSILHFFEQCVSFSTGSNLGDPWLEGSHTGNIIKIVFGQSVYARYAASKQNTNQLPLATIQWFHNISLAVFFPLFLLLFVIVLKRKESQCVALSVVILFGLIGNALVTGPIAMVWDRYQSRVIWLVVFCVILVSFRLSRGSSLRRKLFD